MLVHPHKLPFWRYAASVDLWLIRFCGCLLLLSHSPVSQYSLSLSAVLRHSALSPVPRCRAVLGALVFGFPPHVGRQRMTFRDGRHGGGFGDDDDDNDADEVWY